MSATLRPHLAILAGLLTSPALAADPPVLDPSKGSEVGLVFEAYMSPWQEGGEESDTPKKVPAQFQSTTPSMTRAEREAAKHRAHGVVRFTRDLSRATVDIKVEGVKINEINMFHIHCGSPGVLGPILVDFSLLTDLKKDLADGTMSVVVDDAAIVNTMGHSHGAIATLTTGCLVPGHDVDSLEPVKASTVAGMALLAEQGQLYFNLHTTGQSYFGDIRGQWWPAEK